MAIFDPKKFLQKTIARTAITAPLGTAGITAKTVWDSADAIKGIANKLTSKPSPKEQSVGAMKTVDNPNASWRNWRPAANPSAKATPTPTYTPPPAPLAPVSGMGAPAGFSYTGPSVDQEKATMLGLLAEGGQAAASAYQQAKSDIAASQQASVAAAANEARGRGAPEQAIADLRSGIEAPGAAATGKLSSMAAADESYNRRLQALAPMIAEQRVAALRNQQLNEYQQLHPKSNAAPGAEVLDQYGGPEAFQARVLNAAGTGHETVGGKENFYDKGARARQIATSWGLDPAFAAQMFPDAGKPYTRADMQKQFKSSDISKQQQDKWRKSASYKTLYNTALTYAQNGASWNDILSAAMSADQSLTGKPRIVADVRSQIEPMLARKAK